MNEKDIMEVTAPQRRYIVLSEPMREVERLEAFVSHETNPIYRAVMNVLDEAIVAADDEAGDDDLTERQSAMRVGAAKALKNHKIELAEYAAVAQVWRKGNPVE